MNCTCKSDIETMLLDRLKTSEPDRNTRGKTMNIDRKVIEQALDALAIGDNIALVGSAYTPKSIDAGLAKMRTAMEALREALAQPQPVQESEYCDPSSTIYKLDEMVMSDCGCSSDHQRPLDRIAARIQSHIDTTPQPAQPQPQPVQEPVMYQFRWTNPAGQQVNDTAIEWTQVEPRWNGTVQEKCAELLSHRYGEKPCYEVRALYTFPQAQPAQPQTQTPDMFWNSDDADQPHDSIECFLNDQICQHDLEVGAVFTIWRAKKLPSVTIRVTAIDEEECEAEYEVIEQAHGIKGTT